MNKFMTNAILVITDYNEMQTEIHRFDSVESARVRMNEDLQGILDDYAGLYDIECNTYEVNDNYARIMDMEDDYANVEWNIIEIGHKKVAEKFAGFKKLLYLCISKTKEIINKIV